MHSTTRSSQVKKSFLILATAALILPFNAYAGSAVADVALTPAGDFKAKTEDVSGFAIVKGDTVSAQNIIVNLKNLKTGLALRDKHAKEKYLEVDKYPEMKVVKAEGKGGKGKARIQYRGVEHDVEGTYKISGDKLIANFPMKLSDYKITGIRYMGVGVDDEIKVNVEVPIKK